MMKRLIAAITLAGALSACGGAYTLVEPKPIKVAEYYTVDPQIAWSRTEQNGMEVWTVDGPLLSAVRFFDGREDGESIFEPGPDKEMPEFDKDMTAFEVQELLVDTMAVAGATAVEAKNLRPWEFGSVPGFRFELGYLNQEGLEYDAIVVGAIADETLYLVVYEGTRLYYFPKYRGYFEDIVASIRMAV